MPASRARSPRTRSCASSPTPDAPRPVVVPRRVRGRPRRRRRRGRGAGRELAAGDDPREPRPAVGVRAADRGRGLGRRPAGPAGAPGRDARLDRARVLDLGRARPGRRVPALARRGRVQTTYNTAGAAKQIAERGERGAAAVASARVADIYGLEVLADDIQGGDDNRTRFAVITRPGDEASARAAATTGGDRRTAADDDRVRGAQRAGLAAPIAGRLRRPRAEPVAARVPALDRPRRALGVPVLGRPGRRPGGSRLRGRARRAGGGDRGRPDPRHLPAGSRGLEDDRSLA